MRSSLLFTSALALGALARPQLYRRVPLVVTEMEVVTTTVVVYVTEDYVETFSSSSMGASSTTFLQSTSAATSALPSASGPASSSLPLSTVSTTGLATSSSTASPVVTQTPSPSPSVSFSASQPPKSSTEPQPDPQRVKESSFQVSYEQKSASSSAPPPTSTPTPATTTAASLSDHLSGPDQAYLSAGPDYQAAVLYHHNAARANHDADPLAWDAECEANARIVAKKCQFEHFIPEGANEGQNLFTVSGDAFNVTAGITTSWYQGELESMMPFFGQNNIPDEVFHRVGHLTQLVWKASTKVGCVSLDCGSSMIVGGSSSSMNKYTVCNYSPAGNIDGEYAANVAAPISSTNLGGWAN